MLLALRFCIQSNAARRQQSRICTFVWVSGLKLSKLFKNTEDKRSGVPLTSAEIGSSVKYFLPITNNSPFFNSSSILAKHRKCRS